MFVLWGILHALHTVYLKWTECIFLTDSFEISTTVFLGTYLAKCVNQEPTHCSKPFFNVWIATQMENRSPRTKVWSSSDEMLVVGGKHDSGWSRQFWGSFAQELRELGFCKVFFPQTFVRYGWWFGFLGSPYERDCYLGAPLESQTTNFPLADFPDMFFFLLVN